MDREQSSRRDQPVRAVPGGDQDPSLLTETSEPATNHSENWGTLLENIHSGVETTPINKMSIDPSVHTVETEPALKTSVEAATAPIPPSPQQPVSQPDLFQSLPGGFLLSDENGTIQAVDQSLAVLLRTSRHRLPGKALITFIESTHQAVFKKHLDQVRRSEAVLEWKSSLKLKNGASLPALIEVVSTLTDPGQPLVLRWFIRDLSSYSNLEERLQQEVDKQAKARAEQARRFKDLLAQESLSREQVEIALEKARATLGTRVRERTAELAIANEMLQGELLERRRAEMEAARRARQLSALHSATSALLTTLELESLLGQILDAATNAIPAAEKGMLHLMARDTGQLEMRAVIGYSDPRIQKFNFPGSKGYVAKAVKERAPLLIGDVQNDPSVRYEGTIPEVRAICSAVVAPLILNEEVLGVLSLDSSTKDAFTQDDLELLVSFAVTATAAIHNAMLHGEVAMLAITDTLTGIYNRRGFFELARREVERTRRFGRPLSAIMLDMDNFKDVNDTYGHANGDQVLHFVAERLHKNIRDIDVLGRYGGDEFIILLPETDLFMASNVAERLRQCICNQVIIVNEITIKISVSVGVARLPSENADLNLLLERADSAMYAAKQAGKNRIVVI